MNPLVLLLTLTMVDYAPSLLADQVEACGPRESYMAAETPAVFYAEEINPEMCLPMFKDREYCGEDDGTTAQAFRFRRHNTDGEPIITMEPEQAGLDVIWAHQQWILDTYCVDSTGVGQVGAYAAELISLELDHIPSYVYQSQEYLEVYGMHDMGENPFPPGSFQEDIWGSRILAGIFAVCFQQTSNPDFSHASAVWDAYAEILDGGWVAEWQPSYFDDIERGRDMIFDPDGIIGAVGTPVIPTTWGMIRRYYHDYLPLLDELPRSSH